MNIKLNAKVATIQQVADFYLSHLKPEKFLWQTMAADRMQQIWDCALDSPNVSERTKQQIKNLTENEIKDQLKVAA